MKGVVIHFKKLDWILIISAFLLVGIGLLSLYSSSLGQENFLNFRKQISFFAVGFFLMFLFAFLDWRNFRDNPYLILGLYILSLILLIGLFLFAPEIRGVKGWYRLGPLTFGPIELVKIVLIIILAKYFSTRHIEMYRVKHILLSGFYIFLPAILIFFQPDLGSVLILLFLWVGILIISGIKLRHFLILTFCAILLLIFSWTTFLRDYQKERILSFIRPVDPLGIDWSQNQAKIAIGSGGILGQGFGQGSQTQHGFLPEPQTDFIFAAFAEEFGFIGIIVLLLLFTILIWRIIKIALTSSSNFPRLFSTGFAILIISQLFINIGMNLGILPIIGIPLPLISYGGSNLIAFFICLGILQSFKIN